ncbi:uncharacterized protein C1orf100-like [Scomber scombrus]|uniref:Uncharacterized protein C1orf100-like n=1 Tax=Scomber scombrus TaxID=13677 RepID=A0AAV1Q586_SCOSC
MAGSGVALRLHEFRESPDSRKLNGPNITSRQGRDVHGLYPGQICRVHVVQSKDLRPRCLQESYQSPNSQREDYQQSFDVRTLQALTVWKQRPLQTTYQEQFGLLSLQ